MADAALFSDVIFATQVGISSASDKRLDEFYREHEESFASARDVDKRMDQSFEWILTWKDIHKTAIMKPYNFYTLTLVIIHNLGPLPTLLELYPAERHATFQKDVVLANLGSLATAQEEPGLYSSYKEYVEACSGATTRRWQRETRFLYFCRALQSHLEP